MGNLLRLPSDNRSSNHCIVRMNTARLSRTEAPMLSESRRFAMPFDSVRLCACHFPCYSHEL